MKKKFTLFCLLLLCITTAAFSCSPAGATSTSSTSPVTVSQPLATTSLPRYIVFELDLSSLPAMGKTVELTYTVNVEALWRNEWGGRVIEDLAQSRAWVEFTFTDINGSYSAAKYSVQVPLSEVAADALVWEGDALENRNIVLSGNFQIPREGIWTITGYFSTANWDEPLVRSYQYAVADGTAAIMSGPEFSRGPLGYLGNFPYGRNVPDRVLNETNPFLLKLDISKAPKAGEEAVLTCRIISLYDVADFPTKITFSTYQKAVTGTQIPGANLLVKGDLEWRGSLKAGQPVEFSSTIKFPEEGDWLIRGWGNILTSNTGNTGSADVIRMTITSNTGYFGWQPYPYTAPTNGITTPPATLGPTK